MMDAIRGQDSKISRKTRHLGCTRGGRGPINSPLVGSSRFGTG
jgi:hypothetical protein